MMLFLYLTALLSLLRRSLVAQTGQYSFSELAIYNLLSDDRVNSILQDADGLVRFSTMPALTVMMDARVNFFTSNMMIVSRAGADWNFVVTGANFLSR